MLNAEQIDKVRLALSGDGWNHVMKPAIINRGRQALKALALAPGPERSAEYKGTDFDTDDGVLRAMIRDCEWMAVVWDNEVSVHDRNRQLDELDQAANPNRTANP